MNRVTGRVLHKETNEGLPNLLVVVYDIDPEIRLESILDVEDKLQIISLRDNTQIFRLGSLLTAIDGSFELEYEDDEFQSHPHSELRPDLFICVFSPEGNTQTSSSIIHASPEIRYNAGRSETYLIYITSQQLEAAGISVPSSVFVISTKPEKLEDVIKRAVEAEENRQKLNEGFRQIYAKRIAHKQTIRKPFVDNARQPLLKSLSTISEDLAQSQAFISHDEGALSVTNKRDATIKARIEKVINQPSGKSTRAPVKGYLALTDEQIKKLKGAVGNSTRTIDDVGEPTSDVRGEEQRFEITEEKMQELFPGSAGSAERSTYFLSADVIARYCRDKTTGERCLDGDDDTETGSAIVVNGGSNAETEDEETDGSEEELDTNEMTGSNIDLSAEDSIPRYIASLVEQVDPTYEPVVFGKKKRAEQQDIQGQIDQLSLRAGPADVPAFYDFHNLQIAFEHVWQEAIDHNIINASQNLYEYIVELGGDPGNGTIQELCENATDLADIGCTEPPEVVVQFFDITIEQWNVLSKSHQNDLEFIATGLSQFPETFSELVKEEKRRQIQRGQSIIQYAQNKLESTASCEPTSFTGLNNILTQLCERLNTPYSFHYFAAKEGRFNVNFGILLTYRQRWEPQAYQAGELVKTVTLKPKEVRKFTKRTDRKRKRSEKEVENSIYSRRDESTTTTKAEAVIISNAQAKTNFTTTADGSFKVGIADAGMQASFANEAGKSSNETKKDFHEAVVKAAEEYKNDRKTEVSTEESFEEEFTESGEIMNPNDELPVTFLFYELQRRYKVKERLHRVLPVVLVAQEVPNPAEIDEDWIIVHDWILRRVLLDDSFIPALNYLSTQVVGDEFALKEMKKHIDQLQQIVKDLKEEVVAYRDLVGQRYTALERAIERTASALEEDSGGGGLFGVVTDVIPGKSLIDKGVELFTGGDITPEASRVRERAARDAYEKAMQDERELMARLNRAIATHNAATEAYNKKLSEHLNQKAQIARLQVHIKQNILYYMQAIWLHEPPDQRFLRLHKVEVPVFEGNKTYTIQPSPLPFISPNLPLADNWVNTSPYEYEVDVTINPNFETKPLVEVADLDNLLGFKGNYMIFRLLKSNVLTEFMLDPYINREWNTVYDPDIEGSMSLDEFSDYVCCLKERLEPELFERMKPELKELLKRLLTSPLRDNEEIVVPTDSLFIEALPGTYSILEDFKLMHRAIDVNKADAEHKEQVLENIRRVARLLDNQLEDPDINAKYIFEGNANASFNAPGGEGDPT